MIETTDSVWLLCGSAGAIALLHTALGPDHYVPFVAMSRAGAWSTRRTIGVTLLCGLGHVLASAVLGAVGIALGAASLRLEGIERFRGDLSAWMFLAFGLVYFSWGMRRALRNKPHAHLHIHGDGTTHVHRHVHMEEHLHVHRETPVSDPVSEPVSDTSTGEDSQRDFRPWILFIVFLFGPCEPLIPFLIYPAAKGTVGVVVLVTAVFAVVTLATMTAAVLVGLHAVERVRSTRSRVLGRMERYGHAMAGLVLLLCGVGICTGL